MLIQRMTQKGKDVDYEKESHYWNHNSSNFSRQRRQRFGSTGCIRKRANAAAGTTACYRGIPYASADARYF